MNLPSEIWQEITWQCNILGADSGSWWSRIKADPDIVVRCDPSSLVVRLCGQNFLEIGLIGPDLGLKIAHEYLIPAMPGSRAVLTAHKASPPCVRLETWADLSSRYDLVRQRVCAQAVRRTAVLDQLYARHHCIIGVDAPLPWGRADLVALAPSGVCVCLCVYYYGDQRLRLRGQHGMGASLRKVEAKLRACPNPQAAIADMIARMRSLDGPWARRFTCLPQVAQVYPKVRLLIVDFDQDQRHGGLTTLRHSLEQELGPGYVSTDILTIGDPGNLKPAAIFAGIDPDQCIDW